MTKFVKSAAKASTAIAAPSEKTAFDGTEFAYHLVEVTGGKKYPVGLKTECWKAGLSSYKKPYAIIIVDDEEKFIDPGNLSVLKPLAPARVALIKSEQEAAREATLIVSGKIRNETEKSVCLSHHGWYKPCWIPKSLISKVGDHDDGEQGLYEVPLWKLKYDHRPDDIEALEALQSGFLKMLAPKAVPGKTTTIKKAK